MAFNQMVKSYFLRFQMSGISEPIIYLVSQEESERLRQVLQDPERKHRTWPFVFFTATDGQKVTVSIADIQMVTFGWDIGLAPEPEEEEPPLPKIEIYYRNTAQPYQAFLGDPGLLEAIFLANAFEPEEEPFVFFLDGEGEEVSFRPAHMVVLAYYWEEEKRNRSLVYWVRGQSPDDDSSRGMWRIQVWQSEQDATWAADLEFVADGQAETIFIETYGPGDSKSEAVEMARKELEESWLNPPGSTVF